MENGFFKERKVRGIFYNTIRLSIEGKIYPAWVRVFRVTLGAKEHYEVRVIHPCYNLNREITVLKCDSYSACLAGQQQWVNKITKDQVPLIIREIDLTTCQPPTQTI